MSRHHLPQSAPQIIGRRERDGTVHVSVIVGVNNDLEGLHTDAGVLRGQPLEVGLVLQHFHCGRYMGRTARANTGLQRENISSQRSVCNWRYSSASWRGAAASAAFTAK